MLHRKQILILMAILMLGQSVLVSADVHMIFEEADIHHMDHDHDEVEDQVSGDDCEHSCSSHAGSVLLIPSHHSIANSSSQTDRVHYQSLYSSVSSKVNLRPPIA